MCYVHVTIIAGNLISRDLTLSLREKVNLWQDRAVINRAVKLSY